MGEVIQNRNEEISKPKELNPLASKLQILKRETRAHVDRINLLTDLYESKSTDPDQIEISQKFLEEVKELDTPGEAVEYLEKAGVCVKVLNEIDFPIELSNITEFQDKIDNEIEIRKKNKFGFLGWKNGAEIKRLKVLETEAAERFELFEELNHKKDDLIQDMAVVYTTERDAEFNKIKNLRETFFIDVALDTKVNEATCVSDRSRSNMVYKQMLLSLTKMAVQEEIDKLNRKIEDIGIEESIIRANWFGGDITVWKEMKSKPIIKEIFGDIVEAKDEAIYNHLLSESLIDMEGHYIVPLEYYPTPETVKTLLMLAGAEDKKHRLMSTNGVLENCSNDKNWGKLIDETMAKYPELITVREILKNWKDKTAWEKSNLRNRKGIKEAMTPFMLTQLNNDDERVVRLAAETIPVTTLIDEIDSLDLSSSKSLLTEGMGTGRGYLSVLTDKIRDYFVNSKQNDFDVLKKFEVLSERILNHDINLLGVGAVDLTGSKIVEMLLKTELKLEDTGELLNMVDQVRNQGDGIVAYISQELSKPDWKIRLPVVIEKFSNLNNLGIHTVNFDDNLLRNIVDRDLFTTLEKYKTLTSVGNLSDLGELCQVIAEGKISKLRANFLVEKKQLKKMMRGGDFDMAIDFPQIMLETDEGMEFFDKCNEGKMFTIDSDLDMKIGNSFEKASKTDMLIFNNFITSTFLHELEQLENMSSSEQLASWKLLLTGFVVNNAERIPGLIYSIPEDTSKKIIQLFEDPKVRDLCLQSFRNEWYEFLKTGNIEGLPFSLVYLSRLIGMAEGAGPLTQIESISEMLMAIDNAFREMDIPNITKKNIVEGLAKIENRFDEERWSNEERTGFYNHLKETLSVEPELGAEFLVMFDKLSPTKMKSFAKDLFPLYRTKLVFSEIKTSGGRIVYSDQSVEEAKDDILKFATGEIDFEMKKKELAKEITVLFQDRFGIKKIPENIGEEQTRAIRNISTYLVNIHERDSKKEEILAFYLALMINGKWEDFRNGTEIDPKEYLVEEKIQYLGSLLGKRGELDILKNKYSPEFIKLLQEETSNLTIGNIETIDVKLNNIILNLQHLEDPDLYPEKIDKQRLALLKKFGNKEVGAAAARLYLGKEDFGEIKDEIIKILKDNKLEVAPKIIKEYFQDGIKPLATVVNILDFIKENKAETEIAAIRKMLIPSGEIIKLFKKLDESFTPSSGAMALSQDLNYLDNLINKGEKELTEEEKFKLKVHIGGIRGKLIELETIYSGVVKKFSALREGNKNTSNTQFTQKLEEINKIITTQDKEQVITSTLTNNLNSIMENMRACLSCKDGSNNDTNLTFGDNNKFYLYSGGSADQIVFLEEIARENAEKEMAFVMDMVYGKNTPIILENHISTLIKKQKILKEKFMKINLSIFVSDAAIFSSGTSPKLLVDKLIENKIKAKYENINVDITESAMGDHYVEFGHATGRQKGIKSVTGIIINL